MCLVPCRAVFFCAGKHCSVQQLYSWELLQCSQWFKQVPELCSRHLLSTLRCFRCRHLSAMHCRPVFFWAGKHCCMQQLYSWELLQCCQWFKPVSELYSRHLLSTLRCCHYRHLSAMHSRPVFFCAGKHCIMQQLHSWELQQCHGFKHVCAMRWRFLSAPRCFHLCVLLCRPVFLCIG